MLQGPGDDGRADQHVVKLGKETSQRSVSAHIWQAVRAVFGQTPLRLG